VAVLSKAVLISVMGGRQVWWPRWASLRGLMCNGLSAFWPVTLKRRHPASINRTGSRLAALGMLLSGVHAVSHALQQHTSQATAQDATISVLVRDATGQPVPGLAADNFIVKEADQRRAVVGIETEHPPIVAPNTQPQTLNPSKQEVSSKGEEVYVLLVISPMTLGGRFGVMRSASQLLSQSAINCCHIALLDDSGTYTPFGRGTAEVRLKLEEISKKVPKPQYPGGAWMSSATKAFKDLGIMPGRRAVVFASDYESKSTEAYERNPNLLRVVPSMFIIPALQAQAQLYTVQSSGPSAVVPFGNAASAETYSASGPQLLANIGNETASLGGLRSDLLFAAAETGGLPENSLGDALGQIIKDAEGYYILHFRPPPEESDGDRHPIEVTTPLPHLHISATHFYQAPLASSQTRGIPQALSEIMESTTDSKSLQIDTRAWFFPDGRNDVSSLPLSADVMWTDHSTPQVNSTVEIYAKLRNETMDVEVASWRALRRWTSKQGLMYTHWQDVISIYPGAYTLRIVAMDTSSGLLGSKTYSFLVHSASGQSLAVGPIVLSDRCLNTEVNNGSRLRLIDPIRWKGCEIELSTRVIFPVDQQFNLLLRLYPGAQKLSEDFIREWKASLVIADSKETAKRSISLPIQQGEVRGLVISGIITPSEFHLRPGRHKLAIIFQGPGKERFATETEFVLQ
jgi:hypothetical protein